MAFFRGEQVQAQRNLDLEKRRLRLQNDPSAIFMRELSAGLPRAAFQALGNMAVDAARFNLFGGKEKLDLETRAQDLAETAEKRAQRGQDIEVFGALAEGSEVQQKAGEDLGLLSPKPPGSEGPDFSELIKMGNKAFYGQDSTAQAQQLAAEARKKTGMPQVAPTQKEIKETERTVPEDYYVRKELDKRKLESVDQVILQANKTKLLESAKAAKDADIAQANKEIENYAKSLDSILIAGGGLQSASGRKNIIENAKQFADRLQASYPGLNLSTQLQSLRTLEEGRLNKDTVRNLQRFLRKDSARILNAQSGRSSTQYVRDLNRKEEKLVAAVRENQKSIDAKASVVSKFAQNNLPYLNSDGSVNQDRYNAATPQKQKQLTAYANERSSVLKLQKQNNDLVSPETAKKIGLIKTKGEFGQDVWVVENQPTRDLAALADRSTMAADLIATDKASYESIAKDLEEDDLVSIIAASDEELNEEGVRKALAEGKITAKQALDELYSENPVNVANALSNFASESNKKLIGLTPSRQATNVDKNELEIAMGDQGVLNAVYAKRASEQNIPRKSAEIAYLENEELLKNDVALYLQDKKVPFLVTIKERTEAAKILVDQLKTSKSGYGETPTQQEEALADVLGLKTGSKRNALKAALKEGKITAAQNAILGDAFLALDPNHPLKQAKGVESNLDAKIMGALGLTDFQKEKIVEGIDGGKDAGDLIQIQTKTK
tara:strand:+ start:90 stop:2258 length:2169 start_codon:yes stop_codon:yes gene_type:complete